MKNITVSVDEDTYRRARVVTAARDRSLSALVREFLQTLAAGESQMERLKREERTLRERIDQFSAADRLTREAVHARDA